MVFALCGQREAASRLNTALRTNRLLEIAQYHKVAIQGDIAACVNAVVSHNDRFVGIDRDVSFDVHATGIAYFVFTTLQPQIIAVNIDVADRIIRHFVSDGTVIACYDFGALGNNVYVTILNRNALIAL